MIAVRFQHTTDRDAIRRINEQAIGGTAEAHLARGLEICGAIHNGSAFERQPLSRLVELYERWVRSEAAAG